MGDHLRIGKGDTPLFLAKLPGYRFVAKKRSVPFTDSQVRGR
jgi:hypothetical protein